MTIERSAAIVVGVDFGTLSGRAVAVRAHDGAELGSAVHDYQHGVLDHTLPNGSAALPPNWALQVPSDYIQVLQTAIPEAIKSAGVDPANVVGIATDFTACTMLPTTVDGTPLCELPQFADRPHSYVKLWRHHAAQPQADRINALAVERAEQWLARYGGRISAEWEFAKGLELLEEDPQIYAATAHWVEAADWIIWQLCGRYTRNACTAGYKGIRQDGHYPSNDFLAGLNRDFAQFIDDKLDTEIVDLGTRVGGLSAVAAAWTGLPEGIAVAAGNVDAHVTNSAAQATDNGQMVAIMGTSTCHIMNSDVLREVPGMCGVVDGGLTKGSYGYEAGQSGVGDIFSWLVKSAIPADYAHEAADRDISVHQLLTEKASAQSVGEHGLIALDWHSGNRSTLVDHELSGLILGQTLATKPEDHYRALIEATAFGARTIVEAFNDAGVAVEEFVVAGGLIKNKLLMQIYADVLNMPLNVATSQQAPALGSAIHAAVAAGLFADIHAASKAMGSKQEHAFVPVAQNAKAYDVLFAEYTKLHDYFGRGTNEVMHRLREIRGDALVRRSASDDAESG